MQTRVGFNTKIAILKKLEHYSYQAAYFILQDEALASKAACNALLEMMQEDELLIQSIVEQQKLLKSLVIRHSIAVKKSSCWLSENKNVNA